MHALQVRSFIGSHPATWEDPQMFQHDSVEVTAIMQGKGRFRWNQRETPVEEGHVVIIPPRLLHSFHADSAIRFGVLLVENVTPVIRSTLSKLVKADTPRIIRLAPIDSNEYNTLFQRWLRVAFSTLHEPELTYAAWIQVLLLFLFERGQAPEARLSVAQVADFLRTHLDTNVTVAQLAKQAGLSEEGLRSQFRKMYGTTPKQYQQRCRLTEAKWLLGASEREMSSVSSDLGFTHLHSFSTWFKQLEGISPSEWRKSQRALHE